MVSGVQVAGVRVQPGNLVQFALDVVIQVLQVRRSRHKMILHLNLSFIYEHAINLRTIFSVFH